MNSNTTRRRTIAAFVAFTAMAIAPATMALAAPFEGETPPTDTATTPGPESANIALINADATTQLTIHKYQGAPIKELKNNGKEETLPTDAVAVKDVVFKITQVNMPGTMDPVDLKTNAGWEAAKAYHKNLGDAANNLGTLTKEGTTDVNGLATLGGLKVGLYYVQEIKAPAGYTRAADFLVTLPMTDPENLDNWMYNVHVYPKNAYSSATKTVTDMGSWTTDNAGATSRTLDYTISTTINPAADGETLGRYEVYDHLDDRLTLAAGGVSLSLSSGTDLARETDATKNKSTATADYFLYVNGALVTGDIPAGTGGDLVRVIFTDAGLQKLAIAPIGTKVNTVLNTVLGTAGADTDANYGIIDNQASFIPDGGWAEQNSAPADPTDPTDPTDPADPTDPYTPSDPVDPKDPTDPGDPGTPGLPTDQPVSKYGDVRILKYDAALTTKMLEGAEFTLYKDADFSGKCEPAELNSTNRIAGPLKTDAAGAVTFKGLQLSDWYNNREQTQLITYCFVETKAPTGYNLNAEPIEFTLVNAGAFNALTAEDQARNTIKVANEETNLGNALPLTGGAGVGALSGLALLLGAGGVGYYLKSNRRIDDIELDELDD